MAALTDTLSDYLQAVFAAQAADVTARHTAALQTKHSIEYAGEQFNFECVRRGETLACTAAFADIEAIWKRVQRYTAQKARAIAAQTENATTDLYAFSPDEYDLYVQFLREAADTLWGYFYPYVKFAHLK